MTATRDRMNDKRRFSMNRGNRAIAAAMLSLLSLSVSGQPLAPLWGGAAIAQSTASLCPDPVLNRLVTHPVQAGETLDSIAAAHNLLPVTLLAMNPAIQSGSLPPGTTLRIPPFNGAEVRVPAGQTWQDLANTYRVRADVLFEINGCPDAVPNRVFVPGVSWLLDATPTAGATPTETADTDPLVAYPLAARGTLIANYGWQTDPRRDELVFSSGITLAAPLDTAVVAAGPGTVAYVGEEVGLGTLIVINHDQGLQTRYAQVVTPSVKVGDRVQAGQAIAIASPLSLEDETAMLYFEVRTNSDLGWIARDPGDYIPELAVR